MATYVNNLRLKEIATGDSAGTWGTETNTNLEMIGQAFGYGTRAIANASTDNITQGDGSLDVDRSMYLKLTGGGQACTISLLPNTSSKMYIMENATSATLTFTQGSGANVAILAGEVKLIAGDGLGSGAVVYDLLTDLNLAGVTKVDDLVVGDDLTVTDDMTVGGTLGVTGIVTLTDDLIIGDGKTIGSASDVDAMTIAANGQITLTQTLIGTALDIEGNIDVNNDLDVNGTSNLDVVDIDGAVDMASTLAVAGVVTANAGVVVDNFTLDGTTLALSSGDLTLDVAGDIILDADGADIIFKDAGAEFGRISKGGGSDLILNASIADKDIFFTGIDGSTAIAALTLDMSAAGAATFNSTVKAGGTVLATAAALVNSTSAGGFGFASNNTAFYSFGANTSTAGSYTFQNLSSNASVNVTSLSLSSTGAVFNEGSVDADFRVESNGNTHMLFVDGGNNRVGVGTSAPATQLDVHGTSAKINIRDLTSAATGVGGAISFQGFTSGTGSPNNFGKISGTKASGNVGGVLTLATSATNGTMTDRMTISESGNLGIGVAPILLSGNAAPGLTVASNGPFIILKDANNANSCNYIANNSGVMQFGLNADDGGTKVEIAQFGTFGAVFNENSLDLNFRVESNGNANMLFVDGGGDGVGIGTATAGNSTLEVRSTGVDGTFANAIGFQYSGNASEANTISTSVSSTATNSGFKFNVSDGGGSAGKTSVLKITRADMVVNDDSNDYDFRVESDAESNAFTVDGETGQVGVGSRRGFRFGNGNLQGNAGSSGGGYPTIGYNIKFGGTAGQFGTLAQDTSWRMDIGNNNRLQVHSRSSSTAVDANATYTAGPFVSLNGTSWTSSSDARLKENISTITGALDKVKAMRPVNYTWIHDGEGASNQLGFIAQEMAFIVPEVVDIPEDDEVHQGITYEKLVPVLTAALQEALTKIETLETRLTALENA